MWNAKYGVSVYMLFTTPAMFGQIHVPNRCTGGCYCLLYSLFCPVFQPFSDIIGLTDVQEGIIVRCIQRLDEVLKDVRNSARIIGDPVLCQKMEEASSLIKRDIVFAASLYTQ